MVVTDSWLFGANCCFCYRFLRVFVIGFSFASKFSVYFRNYISGLFKKLLAIIVILIFTLIHSRGIIFGTRIQNIFTILKVALIIGLIIAGFTIGTGSFENFRNTANFEFSFSGWKSIGLSLIFVMFAYSGWNSATYIGSEIKKPRKVIPISLLISTGIVMVLYLLLNGFFVYAISPEELKGVPEIAGLAAGKAFGNMTETVISLLISFALVSSLSAFIILGPRVYYSMTREGYFFALQPKSIQNIKFRLALLFCKVQLPLYWFYPEPSNSYLFTWAFPWVYFQFLLFWVFLNFV